MEMRFFEEYKEHFFDKSDETLDSYEYSVRQYYDFCQKTYGWDNEIDIIKKSTWSEVTLFRNYLARQKELSPYSVNVRISGLRSFFKFLMLRHIIKENPAEQVGTLGTKAIEQNRDFLTEDEYKTLLNTIRKPTGGKQDKFSFTSKRDVFMVGLMITGGFRISEILDMKVNQIDMVKRQVSIVGKGSKLRTVPLTQSVINLLKEYIDERDQLETDCDSLFVNIKGGKMTRQGTNKNLKKYCERAGIDKDITNHSLRHTAITKMAENGISVQKIQVIVGHSDSATTSRYYVKHLQTSDVEDMLPTI